ncbi:MAG TPA: hypothetical protein VGG48_19900 [Rhizomicrobium sp.]|jgi:hypothetical protein
MRRVFAAALLVCAATTASADNLAVPTLFQIQPYFDSQSGAATNIGVERQPTLASGYTSRTSRMLVTPMGDGSVVRVEIWLNLATPDVTAVPTATHAYMLIAGLPPVDPTNEFGFAGQYQGFQFATGGQLSLDTNAAMNDPNGSRWYVVVSYPDSLPVNCEWKEDSNVHLVHPCWLSDKSTDSGGPNYGQTPMRVRGDLTYVTSWSLVLPWIASQETAHTVKQLSP